VVKPQLLRTKITAKLQDALPTTVEQVHVAHILFTTQPETGAATPTITPHTDADAKKLADDTLARLQKGEDFATLAKQLSEDPSNKDQGGDLGFFAPTEKGGPMVQAFSDAAFKLTKPGELAEVESSFGWHVIKLIARESRPLDPTALQTARDQAFDNWLTQQKTQVSITFPGLPATAVPPTSVPLPTEPPLPPVTNVPITNTNPVTGTNPITK